MGPAEIAAAATLLDVPISFFYVGFSPSLRRVNENSEAVPMLRIPLAAACLAVITGSAGAEVSDISFARSREMSYLPLMVMEGEKLVEKHAKAAGLGDIAATYYAFARGALNSFAAENPKTVTAVAAALDEAIALIRKDRNHAADVYRRVTEERYTEALQRMVDDPAITYGREPRGLMTYANFMHRTGALKAMPPGWRDLFVPEAATLDGN